MVDGWLDPQGKFWEAYSHHEFASDWLADETDFDPIGTLEKQGWMHVSDGIIYYRKNPTNRQQDIIYDWFMEGKQKINFVHINDNIRTDEGMDVNKFLERFAIDNSKLSKRLS
jgi:hypothetical protein